MLAAPFPNERSRELSSRIFCVDVWSHPESPPTRRWSGLFWMAFLLSSLPGVGFAQDPAQGATRGEAEGGAAFDVPPTEPALADSPGGDASEAPPGALEGARSDATFEASEGDAALDELLGLDGGDEDLAELMAILETPVEVWAAAKTAQSAQQAPAAVTVVTRAQLERWGYRTVADILRFAGEFAVIDDHVMASVGVRGIAGALFNESGNVKVMIDGRPVAFRATAGNALGPELIPFTAIEQVEIVRGPVSALYGADAFLGVVNIVTRNASALNGSDLAAGISYIHERHLGTDLDMTVGHQVGPVSVLVGGRFVLENRAGLMLPKSSPAPRRPTFRENAERIRSLGGESMAFVAKASVDLGPKRLLEFFGEYSRFTRGGDLAPYSHLAAGIDPEGRLSGSVLSQQWGGVGLRFETDLWSDASLKSSVHYFEGAPTPDDRVEVNSDLIWLRRTMGYRGVEGQAELLWTIFDGVTGIVGVEGMFDHEIRPGGDRILKYSVGGEQPGTNLGSLGQSNATIDFYNLAAYAQLNWKILERWLELTAGARIDYHNIYSAQPSGRVALVSQPLDGLFVKLIYGSAFKAPSPLLLAATPLQVGGIVGNANLAPQYVHTVEALIDYDVVKWLSLSAGASYNYLINMAEFSPLGLNQVARNVAEIATQTVHAAATTRFQSMPNVYVRGDWTFAQRNTGHMGYRDELVRHVNPGFPEYVVRAGAYWDPGVLPLGIAVQASLVGPRTSMDSNSLENGEPYALEPYVWLTATISSPAIELAPLGKLFFELSGTNLVGATGPEPGFSGVDYPLPPRTLMFRLRHQH